MTTTNANETLTLAVTGMTCDSCRRHVEHALQAVPGVAAARVDLAQGRATVSFDAGAASPGRLIEAVRDAGYDAQAADEAAPPPEAAAHACGCCAVRIS